MFDLFKRTTRHEEPEDVNPADAALERALEEVRGVIVLLASAQYDLQQATRVAQTVLHGDWAERIQQQANSVEDIHMSLDQHYEYVRRTQS
ncbi:hypothetical protein ACFWEJ_00905 [Promicromonospora sp. NPDC060204]|uniref:hypothetical protein n=1 Tax=Promicromonospora sp. NPDC060204 TaxID=3347071 RepID=UPI0036698E71